MKTSKRKRKMEKVVRKIAKNDDKRIRLVKQQADTSSDLDAVNEDLRACNAKRQTLYNKLEALEAEEDEATRVMDRKPIKKKLPKKKAPHMKAKRKSPEPQHEHGEHPADIHVNYEAAWTAERRQAALRCLHAGLPERGENGYTVVMGRSASAFLSILYKLRVRYRQPKTDEFGNEIEGVVRRDPMSDLQDMIPFRRLCDWTAVDYYLIASAHTAIGVKNGATDIGYLSLLLGRTEAETQAQLHAINDSTLQGVYFEDAESSEDDHPLRLKTFSYCVQQKYATADSLDELRRKLSIIKKVCDE